MAYDEADAKRMRAAIGALPNLSEKRMMGGICFMLDGNMVGGVDRAKDADGRFMFRIGKENPVAASLTGGEPMVMGGRLMRGFFFVDVGTCDDALLGRWAEAALAHARSLPPK